MVHRCRNQQHHAHVCTGENVHYGVPPNPAAPGRIPGGSSSGSAVSWLVGWVLGWLSGCWLGSWLGSGWLGGWLAGMLVDYDDHLTSNQFHTP